MQLIIQLPVVFFLISFRKSILAQSTVDNYEII